MGGVPMGPAQFTFVKHADRTFEVRISGLMTEEVRLREPIPEVVRETMYVFVEWDLDANRTTMRLLPPRDPSKSEPEEPEKVHLEGKPLVEAVASDLRFLRDEWGDSMDDHALRRASPVLRRLLVDNELQRAWKAAGFDREPRIRASSLSEVLKHTSVDRILFASAGGATHKGMAVRAAVVSQLELDRDVKTQVEEAAQKLGERLPDELLGLGAFVIAPCLVALGVPIPRRIVIKYVSNKLGGTHFDERRGDKDEDRLFELLDEVSRHIEVAEKNAIFFELLSIGQAIARSEDIRRFLSATG